MEKRAKIKGLLLILSRNNSENLSINQHTLHEYGGLSTTASDTSRTLHKPRMD